MKNLALIEGKENCPHKWEAKKEDWKEPPGAGPVMEKLPKWQYHGLVRVCTKCERKELTGGTVIVPETPDYFLGGEYELQPDGERGMFIS